MLQGALFALMKIGLSEQINYSYLIKPNYSTSIALDMVVTGETKCKPCRVLCYENAHLPDNAVNILLKRKQCFVTFYLQKLFENMFISKTELAISRPA